MTLAQTREFVLSRLRLLQPVLFSEEMMGYIDSIGYLENDVITWAGKTYKIVGADPASRIVKTIRIS